MQINLGNVLIITLGLIGCLGLAQEREIDREMWMSSYSVLTPHFGILSRADLAVAADGFTLVPYDSKKGVGAAHWQCFLTKHVSLVYDTWEDSNSMGRSGVAATMCSFSDKHAPRPGMERVFGEKIP